MPRVALVHSWACQAGAESRDVDVMYRESSIAAELERRGCEVRAFGVTLGETTSRIQVSDVVSWEYVPADDRRASRREASSVTLCGELEAWRPDLVVLRGAGTGISRSLRHFPRLAVIVGGDPLSSEIAIAHHVFAESESQRKTLSRIVGSEYVSLLHKVSSPSFRAHSRGPFRYDVVVVSSFHPWKNHELLAPLGDLPIHIAFAGDGPLRARVEGLFSGRACRADFLGHLGSAQVAELVATSRLLVHPSLSEGVPRAVWESLEIGTPVVAARGVVDWPVEHGINGLLVDHASMCDLVARLVLGKTDVLDRLSLGASAWRADVDAGATVKSAADEIWKIATGATRRISAPHRVRRAVSLATRRAHRRFSRFAVPAGFGRPSTPREADPPQKGPTNAARAECLSATPSGLRKEVTD